jgi:toxin ParE1/3/4
MNFTPLPCKNTQRLCNFFAQQDRHQKFIDTIENAIFRVIAAPERWPIVEGQIRRCLTLKFSYAILYRVDPDRIVIAAVMNCRRDPSYWKDRL